MSTAVSVPDDGRPRLGRGVRMRFDASRDRHVLLLPETVVVLNGTGAAILSRCDGTRTVAEIVTELRDEYEGGRDQIAAHVRNYLAALVGRRHVEVNR